MSDWQVYAVRYAQRTNLTRGESFVFDDNHDAPHAMDYFMWVLKQGERVILVDTGYEESETKFRDRPVPMDARAALAPLGLDPTKVTEVIVTHLHYDHAGGISVFPNAQLHLQTAEMAYATGACMCHETLRMPFTASHICETITRLYSGKLTFHDGDAQIVDGVTVHCIGGHSRGLQCVRVRTSSGWLVLASDAAHFYENLMLRKPFPIVVDVENMLNGFDRLEQLSSRRELIIPGHDPLVGQVFPTEKADHIFRLDPGPIAKINP